ncbi:MAG: methyltransferase domain-containing protein [Alphaproteobacteria bacterium]|nr:methyltransferase domain-containing protein [Alphaproteobacteria bacterium]
MPARGGPGKAVAISCRHDLQHSHASCLLPENHDWIAQHRKAWAAKAGLRGYYRQEIYARLRRALHSGSTLEIGAGPGLLAAEEPRLPGLVSSDISAGPETEVVCDAHALPFADGNMANIVAVDTLHHLARPGAILAEVSRVLRPGGRLVLVEPWTSPLGWLVYRYLHHENCKHVPDPWNWAAPAGKDPMVGNAVIPKAILVDQAEAMAGFAPDLSLSTVEPFGGPSFMMTGGFRSWGLPWPAIRRVVSLESRLPARLMRLLALRALLVLDKAG